MGFSNDPIDDHQWALRLLKTRSLDGFRAYGAETGLWKFSQAWNHFLFTRDARELAFTTKRLKALADEIYDWQLRFGLKIPYASYDDPRKTITPRERSAWLDGFIEAYKEILDEDVSKIIPRELEDKLPLFCDLVAAIQQDGEAGHDYSEYGVRLGAKKKEEPRKIHPNREAIIKKAKAAGLQDAKLHWVWQTQGNTRIRRPQFISAPFNWELAPEELKLYEKVFEKAFMEYLREQIAEIVPAKAWKNAFLICSLYDEMQLQRHEGRASTKDYGWSYLKNLREREHRRTEERMKVEAEARERRWKPKVPVGPGSSMGISMPGDAPLFGSPQHFMTPGAQAAFERTAESPTTYLDRHFSGDFGDLDKEDWQMNVDSIPTQDRVQSAYRLKDGTTIWIITDPGHEVTTILLPSEY